MPPRSLPYLALLAGLVTAGCATVGPGGSVDVAVAARPLSAGELRASALADRDLAAGWTVTVMPVGQSAGQPASGDRETADVPACQPVLDAIGPANPAASPLAETDLSLTRTGAPQSALYTALLAYSAGRSAVLQSTLDQVLGQCGVFSSASAAHRAASTQHRLARADTPTPEGADGATAFTLTNESGGLTLTQHATVVRVGTALAVFSTVGTAKEPAAAPDPAVVLAQTRKLRAAQR